MSDWVVALLPRALAKVQKVFAVTPAGASAAKSVAIGKDGLTPPM